MTATEIAKLFFTDRGDAISTWEHWICSEPERAWPVYEEILRLHSDDETMYQVGARVRLLLWRFYEPFIERCRELFAKYPRLWRIMGENALDRDRYIEAPYDRQKLIEDYERHLRASAATSAIKAISGANPRRAVPLVIEIIHRAPRHGLETFDVFDVVRDLLQANAPLVIDEIERAARESVLMRRALWEMLRISARDIAPEIAERCRNVIGETTEYTDDLAPWPLPQKLNAFDESLVETWFEAEKVFDAWVDLADMVNTDPAEAWAVTRALIERCESKTDTYSIAAGPLEDLIQNHPEMFEEIAAAARESENLRYSLGGVWMFPQYQAFEKFKALVAELGIRSE